MGKIEDLERLAALHESGALSQEEFESEKRRILGDSEHPQSLPETGTSATAAENLTTCPNCPGTVYPKGGHCPKCAQPSGGSVATQRPCPRCSTPTMEAKCPSCGYWIGKGKALGKAGPTVLLIPLAVMGMMVLVCAGLPDSKSADGNSENAAKADDTSPTHEQKTETSELESSEVEFDTRIQVESFVLCKREAEVKLRALQAHDLDFDELDGDTLTVKDGSIVVRASVRYTRGGKSERLSFTCRKDGQGPVLLQGFGR